MKAAATVQVNAKGQITLPRSLRDQVGLRTGSVVRVRAVNGGLVLEPSGGEVMALAGIIQADRTVSLDELPIWLVTKW